MIVADVNVVAYLVLPGEHTPLAESVFAKDSAWYAPLLWRHEFLNVLATYCRAKLLSVDQALVALSRAEQLFPGPPYAPDPRRVLELAVASGCSGYDCQYVALARFWKVKLVTMDAKVLAAFPDTAISMKDFAAVSN